MTITSKIMYVAAQFAAMGATPEQLIKEIKRLSTDQEYLAEWAITTGYYE